MTPYGLADPQCCSPEGQQTSTDVTVITFKRGPSCCFEWPYSLHINLAVKCIVWMACKTRHHHSLPSISINKLVCQLVQQAGSCQMQSTMDIKEEGAAPKLHLATQAVASSR